jgi:MFS family permease
MSADRAMEDLPPAIKNRLLATCMAAIFLAALDQTIVAPALPIMAQEFGNWTDISWVVTAYLLVTTAVIPIYGKASDIYGRRPAMGVAITIFCLGSLLCATATNILMLSLARGIQALGGGGLIALSMTIIGDIYAPRERGRYQGYISGIYASAAIIGPSLGGLLSDLFGWSAIFWINLPLGAATLLAALTGMRHLNHVARPRYLDLPGAVLFVCGTSALVLAVNSGGVRWNWLSGEIAGLAALAGLSWFAFARRVARIDNALISRSVMVDRVVIAAIAAAFFGVGTLVGLSAYVPSFFQVGLGLTATQAGFATIPMLLGTAVGAIISGKSLAYVDNYKRIPISGLTLAVLMCAGLALWLDRISVLRLALMLPFVSMGIGALMPISLITVQNVVRKDHMGSATAVVNFSRQLGAVLIVAAFGAVLFYGSPPPASFLHTAAGAQPEIQAVSRTGFSRVLWLSALTLLLALSCFAAIEQRPLRSGRQ